MTAESAKRGVLLGDATRYDPVIGAVGAVPSVVPFIVIFAVLRGRVAVGARLRKQAVPVTQVTTARRPVATA